MGIGVAIPLHLAVHVLGLTVALGLCAYAATRRREAGPAWPGIVAGGLLLAGAHLAVGLVVAGPQGWPLVVRTAGYAALAVGAAGGLAGVSAALLVVPGGQLAAGLAGLMAAVATTRGVLGRGRQVWWLAGGLALWAAGDVALAAGPGLSAGLSLAGSGAAGWWLVRRAGTRSLFARFAAAFLAVLLVLAVGIASASGLVYTSDLRGEQVERLAEVAAAQADELADDWPSELAATGELLATGAVVDELAEAAGRGSPQLDRRAQIIATLPGVDVVGFVDDRGRVLGSAQRGADLDSAQAAALSGSPLVELALAGSTARGLVVMGGGRLVALGVVPVAPRGDDGEVELDRLAGALVVGRELSEPTVVAGIRADTGAETALLLDGDVIATTLASEQAADLPSAVGGDVRTDLVALAGTQRVVVTAPLAGAGEAEVATLALALDPGAFVAAETTATRSLFAVALVGLAVTALLAAAVARRTTRPVARLTRAAEQVSAGDLGVRVGLDRDDELGRLAGAFNDMTSALSDREQALLHATESETSLRARLEGVTASMGEALVAVDAVGTVVTANPAAGELLGARQDELLGRPVGEVLIGRDESGAALSAVLGGPRAAGMAAARGVVVRTGADGGERRIEVAATAAPLRGNVDAVDGRVYVLRDVTGEAAAGRLQTELVANVSHELKTPLTPIRGYAELLRRRDIGADRVATFADNILTSVESLERIVGLLVDLAELEAGRTAIVAVPTSLDRVVDDTLAEWREREPDRRFTRRVQRRLPDVEVDPPLLRRVLEELVHNAVKFSSGPVRVNAVRDGDRVAIVVRDEGPGIEPDFRERILADFAQADSSSTRQHGGLGLGLSIVQRILTRFGGSLAIASEPDRGTDVTVWLQISSDTPDASTPVARVGVET